MPNDNMGPVKLNRHGRRSQVAMLRKLPEANRKYKAQVEHDKVADARRAGLEMRLEKVRKRTFQRKAIEASKKRVALKQLQHA